MGPRPRGRGSADDQANVIALLRLQWGLDHVVEDLCCAQHRARHRSLTSMGPRPRGRGSAALRREGARLWYFNGASTTWSRICGRAHSTEAHYLGDFNGASTTWSRICCTNYSSTL